jgi:hypothetical protein
MKIIQNRGCKLCSGIRCKVYSGIGCKILPEWGVKFTPEYAAWEASKEVCPVLMVGIYRHMENGKY